MHFQYCSWYSVSLICHHHPHTVLQLLSSNFLFLSLLAKCGFIYCTFVNAAIFWGEGIVYFSLFKMLHWAAPPDKLGFYLMTCHIFVFEKFTPLYLNCIFNGHYLLLVYSDHEVSLSVAFPINYIVFIHKLLSSYNADKYFQVVYIIHWLLEFVQKLFGR